MYSLFLTFVMGVWIVFLSPFTTAANGASTYTTNLTLGAVGPNCEDFKFSTGSLRSSEIKLNSAVAFKTKAQLDLVARVVVQRDKTGPGAISDLVVERRTFESAIDTDAALKVVETEALNQALSASSIPRAQQSEALKNLNRLSQIAKAWISGIRCIESEAYRIVRGGADFASNKPATAPTRSGRIRPVPETRRIRCESLEFNQQTGRSTWRQVDPVIMASVREHLQLELSRPILNPVDPSLSGLGPLGFMVQDTDSNGLNLTVITNRDPSNQCGATETNPGNDVLLQFFERAL